MLLGYSIPAFQSPEIIGGTWLTDVRLFDRDPQERTRIQWSTGPQTTASNVIIRGYCGDQYFIPRTGALLGLEGVPPGLRVEVRGLDEDLSIVPYGGNSTSQRTVTFDDGTVGVRWVFGSSVAAPAYHEVVLYNDRNGSVCFGPGATLDIGLSLISPGAYIPHVKGWRQNRTSTSKLTRLLGAGVSYLKRPSYGGLQIQPSVCNAAQYRGAGLDNGIDYAKLIAILADDPFVLVVEDISTPNLIQRSGIFGVCSSPPGVASLSKTSYQVDTFNFEEIPS